MIIVVIILGRFVICGNAYSLDVGNGQVDIDFLILSQNILFCERFDQVKKSGLPEFDLNFSILK